MKHGFISVACGAVSEHAPHPVTGCFYYTPPAEKRKENFHQWETLRRFSGTVSGPLVNPGKTV